MSVKHRHIVGIVDSEHLRSLALPLHYAQVDLERVASVYELIPYSCESYGDPDCIDDHLILIDCTCNGPRAYDERVWRVYS